MSSIKKQVVISRLRVPTEIIDIIKDFCFAWIATKEENKIKKNQVIKDLTEETVRFSYTNISVYGHGQTEVITMKNVFPRNAPRVFEIDMCLVCGNFRRCAIPVTNHNKKTTCICRGPINYNPKTDGGFCFRKLLV